MLHGACASPGVFISATFSLCVCKCECAKELKQVCITVCVWGCVIGTICTCPHDPFSHRAHFSASAFLTEDPTTCFYNSLARANQINRFVPLMPVLMPWMNTGVLKWKLQCSVSAIQILSLVENSSVCFIKQVRLSGVSCLYPARMIEGSAGWTYTGVMQINTFHSVLWQVPLWGTGNPSLIVSL